ncbi:MAG: hypothetical protein NTX45_28955 [Proteobacteria bacterium]|nr:hypothetical protein [Pseudomonadota bacterium]
MVRLHIRRNTLRGRYCARPYPMNAPHVASPAFEANSPPHLSTAEHRIGWTDRSSKEWLGGGGQVVANPDNHLGDDADYRMLT